ncbi:MAG: hypothetical protein ACFFDJ_04395 [Candidatus Odinarchaeota archaeon]
MEPRTGIEPATSSYPDQKNIFVQFPLAIHDTRIHSESLINRVCITETEPP